MKILITGDKGYIGSVLTKYLYDNNYIVSGFDTGFFENCNLSKVFDLRFFTAHRSRSAVSKRWN